MKKINIKNLSFIAIILALIFGFAFPTFAKDGSDKAKKISQIEKNEAKRIAKSDKQFETDLLKIGNASWNTGYRAAQNTFNKEMKDARKIYKQDKKVAHTALTASLKVGNGNQDAITQAYNVYRNSLIVALQKMFNSEQVAFNKFITTLKNLTITPTPIPNHAPVANAQSIKVVKNNTTAITLTGSDQDPNTTLKYMIVSSPAHGSLSNGGVDQKYTPNTDYSGSDSFTFKVSDGSLESGVATVSIQVVN